MKLMITRQGAASLERADENLLRRAAVHAARAENIDLPCFADVLLCDDENIRAYNRQHRGVDQPTDVLSFPSVWYPSGITAGRAEPLLSQEWDTEREACFLGEIIISLPRALAQAEAYGHSLQRELSYLLVHGLMHLFGYDHQDEEDKRTMRRQEEKALRAVHELSKEKEAELLRQAKEAMEQAYVPYSGYRVGASLLGADGKVYSGCNVENASFGLTNCGERTALFKAVSEGCQQFEAIAIAAQGFPPWPCGACRQVLSEFCADLPVVVTWDGDNVERSTLQELLPHSFSPASGVTSHLQKGR